MNTSNPFDVVGTDDGMPVPAPPEPEPPPAEEPAVRASAPMPPRRRPGRPKGSRNRTHLSAVPSSPPPAAEPPYLGAAEPGPSTRKEEKNGAALPEGADEARDPGSVWTRLYEESIRKGWNIDDYRICVDRTHMNGLPIQRVTLQPELSGSQMVGDVHLNQTPGEQLLETIIQLHHRNCPPSSYIVRFMSRRSGKTIRQSATLNLEKYEDIQQRKELMSTQARVRQLGTMGPSSVSPGGYPYPIPVPAVASPLPASMPGVDPMTKHLLDAVLGQLNASNAELAALRGQPAPPPVVLPAPAVAPPPAVDPTEQMIRDVERVKRLQALLAPPQPAQPAITAEMLANTIRQTVLQMADAGLLAKPGAQMGAAPAAAPAGPPPDSFEAFVKAEAKRRDFEKVFRSLYPDYRHKDEIEAAGNVVPDPPAPPVASQVVPGSGTVLGEQLRWVPFPAGEEGGMSWKEWGMRMLADNPRRASEILASAAKVLNDGVLQKLLASFQGMGGEAAEAAATHAASAPAMTGGGWSPQT
jgi:hypothetical protein